MQPGDNAMLKIAICDDTREERELVEQYAKRYFDARKQPAEFEIFIPCRMSWTPAEPTISTFLMS